jgi:glyoxylase-like metal-dependent hydrolase (beta-lactamase superfamily II)
MCLIVVAGAGWWGSAGSGSKSHESGWIEVRPGILRTRTLPAGYALVDGDSALLVNAPQDATDLKRLGVKKIDAVLLTHHDRDTCAAANRFLKQGIRVRAPKAAAEWLTPDDVRKHWQTSLPLRTSRASYLVLPTGLEGVDCTLAGDQTIDWHAWTVQVVDAPGHSRDHVAFLARNKNNGPLLAFCGDALASPGKLWAPFTTDWDHWTDAGLTPTAQSLRKLAVMKPDVLLPVHGLPITEKAVAALEQTAAAVEEVAFLKSFERYTKKRLGNAPQYRFLAKEQAESRGENPWSQLSEHLFLTGNTYVLTSKPKACLVIDPWGQLSADQIAKLRRDRGLGPVEVVMFSHAHWDHYDGIYYLPERDKFEVWSLDLVAGPVAEPFRLHAPFLDARPVKFDRRLRDGETMAWREYHFRCHYLPGQSQFTMGLETTIDGKRCFFTADNFFHQDQFSGTGGWMGLNRSYPLPYAASAQKVLDAAPDWVLAEHGGPFEFNAEDFRRRVAWGKASASAANAVSINGNHRCDWDPNRVHVEPLLQTGRAGARVQSTLVAENPLSRPQCLEVLLEGREQIPDQKLVVELPPGGKVERKLEIPLSGRLSGGRSIFPLRVTEGNAPVGVDAFMVIDIQPPR